MCILRGTMSLFIKGVLKEFPGAARAAVNLLQFTYTLQAHIFFTATIFY